MTYNRPCPECNDANATYHLMMSICDKCMNWYSKNPTPPEYIETTHGGFILLRPNPDYDKNWQRPKRPVGG